MRRRGTALLILQIGPRGWGDLRHAPVALPRRKSLSTLRTEEWVDPRAGLGGYREEKIALLYLRTQTYFCSQFSHFLTGVSEIPHRNLPHNMTEQL
jgi:hypothetical protein